MSNSINLRQFFRKQPVLITGATGFIGSHLVKNLLQLNAQVTIVKKPSSSLWRIKDVVKKTQVFNVNLTNKSRLQKLLKNSSFHSVFHLAAKTDHQQAKFKARKIFIHNTASSLNLVDFFLSCPPKVFVNVGSCGEYGDNQAPFHESLREKPTSSYSAAKAAVTHYLDMLHRIYNFPSLTIRPFLTYGPYQIGDPLIPYCIERCLLSLPVNITKGEQTREFHYVSDIVRGILIAAASRKKIIGQIIDLGTGEEHKVKNVVKLIHNLTHSNSQINYGAHTYRPGEAFRFCCQGKKAKKLLNWKSKVSFKKGLLKTIAWYKDYLANK